MQQAVATLAALGFASVALPQHPFDLDPSFRTNIPQVGINSVLPLEDGTMVISGVFQIPPNTLESFRLAKLDHNGDFTTDFYWSGLGGGKMVRWGDRFYVGTDQTVRRILLSDGHVDPSWSEMNDDPLFGSLQGGDYHVFPDGRVLMSGLHNLMDTARGFIGYYNLIWFTNTGRMDTTRIHRRTDGVVYAFKQLPDGKFICSAGTATEFEGTPIHVLFRIFPDGSLDTSFHPALTWGEATDYLPLEDGRVVVAGQFKFEGSSDTLALVRLLPDGTLDETFNNHHIIRKNFNNNENGYAWSITRLTDERYAFTGIFDRMDGQMRGGIALLDSSGTLLDGTFTGAGAIPYQYMGYPAQAIRRIVPAGDGGYYICGAYKGYDDGTVNDPDQRMVSRLYGLNVGIEEQEQAHKSFLQIYPNPAADAVQVVWVLPEVHEGLLIVRDLAGREVHRTVVTGTEGRAVLDTREWGMGSYTVELVCKGQRMQTEKLIVRQ